MQGSVMLLQVGYGGSHATCLKKSPGLSQQSVASDSDEIGDLVIKWEI